MDSIMGEKLVKPHSHRKYVVINKLNEHFSFNRGYILTWGWEDWGFHTKYFDAVWTHTSLYGWNVYSSWIHIYLYE